MKKTLDVIFNVTQRQLQFHFFFCKHLHWFHFHFHILWINAEYSSLYIVQVQTRPLRRRDTIPYESDLDVIPFKSARDRLSWLRANAMLSTSTMLTRQRRLTTSFRISSTTSSRSLNTQTKNICCGISSVWYFISPPLTAKKHTQYSISELFLRKIKHLQKREGCDLMWRKIVVTTGCIQWQTTVRDIKHVICSYRFTRFLYVKTELELIFLFFAKSKNTIFWMLITKRTR